jgi:hypothetical protein
VELKALVDVILIRCRSNNEVQMMTVFVIIIFIIRGRLENLSGAVGVANANCAQ